MDFMKKMGSFSKKVGTTASETYNAVINKSGKIIEGTKSKFEISEKEDKIEEIFISMGKTVYEMYKKGENVGDVLEQNAEKIDDLNKEIEEMEKKLLSNKGLKECCNCGKIIPVDSHFCPKCGTEQSDVQILKNNEIANKKVCNKCNAICDDEDEFCGNCGEKIEK